MHIVKKHDAMSIMQLAHLWRPSWVERSAT
jgi:hypothetical protein